MTQPPQQPQAVPFFLDEPIEDCEGDETPMDDFALASTTEIVQSSLSVMKVSPSGRHDKTKTPGLEVDGKEQAKLRREKIVKVKQTTPSERKSERLREASTEFTPSPLTRKASMGYSSTATSNFAVTPSSVRRSLALTDDSPAPGTSGTPALTPTNQKAGGGQEKESVILRESELFIQRCIAGGIGSPRQRCWSKGSGGSPAGSPSGRAADLRSTASAKKAYEFLQIDPAEEVDRFVSTVDADTDDGACNCDYLTITADTRGFDYSRYHAHALYHACSNCQRQPSAFLCLHCLESFCPSHVRAHHERSEESKTKCCLFLNIMDIQTSFDRIFWCEKCKRFTWKFTDEYEPFSDQIAVTKGTYLDQPVTDVWLKQYVTQISNAKEAETGASFAGRPPVFTGRTTPPPAHLNARRRSSAGTENCLPESAAACPVLSIDKPKEEEDDEPEFLVQKWNNTGSGEVVELLPTVTAIGTAMQGWRSGQEDAEAAFTLEMKNTTPGALDVSCSIFCVFDGHGGDAVAKIAARDIKRHLEKEFNAAPPLTQDVYGSGADEDVFGAHSIDASVMTEHFTTIFTNAFLNLDREIQESDAGNRGEYNCVGCTACVVAIMADFIICANIGDSGAILFHPAEVKRRRLSLMDHGASSQSSSPLMAPQAAVASPTGSVASGAGSPPHTAPGSGPPSSGSGVGIAGFNTSSPLNQSNNSMAGASSSPHVQATELPSTIAMVKLSEAHRLSQPAEAERVKAAGYSITDDRIEGMLAVPRALGDYDFKQNGAKPPQEQAVTACPDVVIMPRKRRGRRTEFAGEVSEEKDWTIIIACDGIWDTLPADVVCRLAHRYVYNGNKDPECSPYVNNLSLTAESTTLNALVGGSPGRGPLIPNCPQELDQTLIAACNAIFDHCIAPSLNDEGLGMDNMSIMMLRPTDQAALEDLESNVSL